MGEEKLTIDEQALNGSSEPLSGRFGKPLDSLVAEETLEVRATAAAACGAPSERCRLARCHVCWNPGLGRVRPMQHTYSGDGKFAPPSPIAPVSAAAAAETAVAAAISLPRSQGSLFGSAVSDSGERSLPKTLERHPFSERLSSRVEKPLGSLVGEERPEVLATAPASTPEDRMTALEGMMMDVRRELQAVRNDLHK